jgi:hypothetical protein
MPKNICLIISDKEQLIVIFKTCHLSRPCSLKVNGVNPKTRPIRKSTDSIALILILQQKVFKSAHVKFDFEDKRFKDIAVELENNLKFSSFG